MRVALLTAASGGIGEACARELAAKEWPVSPKMYAERYAAEGIRMCSVLPGWVATHPVPEAELARIPLRRAADPKEIASVVAFLLSEEASYLTGENLRVDGGLLRSI
jgi:NAD(P)-dependent dehydrogenase (short-subunit alcohol dehydrogenase family)